MKITPKLIASALLATGLMMGAAACSPVQAPSLDAPAQETTGAPVAEETASPAPVTGEISPELAKYVELERATLPEVLKLYPDLYSDITADGSIYESTGQDGIPAGTFSLVTFNFVYANEMDWAATSAGLDQQKSTIDDLCTSTVFPTMEQTGVTGPLALRYNYSDATDPQTPQWSYACSQP